MSFHPFSAAKATHSLLAGKVSPRDELRYWFGLGLVGMVGSYQWAYFGLDLNWFLLYDIVVFVAILWLGLVEAYKANAGDAGVDFIKRLSIIGLPLFITFLVVSQVIHALGWHVFPLVFSHGDFRDPAFAWQIFMFVFTAALQVWFWWRMVVHIRFLNLART